MLNNFKKTHELSSPHTYKLVEEPINISVLFYPLSFIISEPLTGNIIHTYDIYIYKNKIIILITNIHVIC